MEKLQESSNVELAFEMGFYQGIRSFETRLQDIMKGMWLSNEDECARRKIHFLESKHEISEVEING